MTWVDPIPNGMPEPWAVEWGSDRFGVFMEFGVGDVMQRLRWVPPGRFVMGSPEGEAGRFEDEGPQHEVEFLRGFWLADTPVTQALWEAVMGNNPSEFKGPERPVEQVSWHDCQEFLAKLNKQVHGLDARLPTEAEWEYACRAGTTAATWVGDLEIQLDGIAWYYANSPKGTRPVRGNPPNPWGFYDMLGNVWEWCEDWFGRYSAAPVTNPRGPTVGSGRVSRGGSWGSLARFVRAASRYADDPSYRAFSLGFRLARGQGPSPGGRSPKTKSGRRAEPPALGLPLVRNASVSSDRGDLSQGTRDTHGTKAALPLSFLKECECVTRPLLMASGYVGFVRHLRCARRTLSNSRQTGESCELDTMTFICR